MSVLFLWLLVSLEPPQEIYSASPQKLRKTGGQRKAPTARLHVRRKAVPEGFILGKRHKTSFAPTRHFSRTQAHTFRL
eukprot:scaffold1006_cov270-Pinguiococcus_pyrenoidosus.AAC.28